MTVKIREPQVIWEQMDNEVIIISLINGHYYNAQGTGMTIWLCLAQQMPQDEIIKRCVDRYQLPQQKIEYDIQQFINWLSREELVLTTSTHAPAASAPSNWPDHYAEPTLTKYTDMQELLLIDPIHEVDEHGWPNRYPIPKETV